MGYKIEEIEGIGPVFAEKLGTAGIGTTADLLKLCSQAIQRLLPGGEITFGLRGRFVEAGLERLGLGAQPLDRLQLSPTLAHRSPAKQAMQMRETVAPGLQDRLGPAG